MTPIDIAILAIIVISSLISIVRGFLKEAVSLAAWILAFWAAYTHGASFQNFLPDALQPYSLRLAVSIVILFILVLILGGLVNLILSRLVAMSGLSGTDRTLGVVFGLLRGVVVIALLVWLAGLTALPQDPWWQQSRLIGYFEPVVVWLNANLPSNITRYFVYS
jgi:membrane protein required for colicin V production